MLRTIKSRETKQREDAKAAEVAAAQALDAQAKSIRADHGAKVGGVEAAKQKKADAEKAAKARLEGATASLKKLKGIGATTGTGLGADLLGLDTKVLEDAIKEAKDFKVPDEALAKYNELLKKATTAQTQHQILTKCRTLVAAEPLKLDTKALRQGMADAAAAGVADDALAEFKAPLVFAEKEQARKNILDVCEAISDPHAAKEVNVEQLRKFLESEEVKSAGEPAEKLAKQLEVVEAVQGHLATLDGHAFPPKTSVLKIAGVQLRFALDEVKESGLIPEDMLQKYEARMQEANEAQAQLKKLDELKAAVKDAKTVAASAAKEAENKTAAVAAAKAEAETAETAATEAVTASEAKAAEPKAKAAEKSEAAEAAKAAEAKRDEAKAAIETTTAEAEAATAEATRTDGALTELQTQLESIQLAIQLLEDVGED